LVLYWLVFLIQKEKQIEKEVNRNIILTNLNPLSFDWGFFVLCNIY
jgi:hypothetical protein